MKTKINKLSKSLLLSLLIFSFTTNLTSCNNIDYEKIENNTTYDFIMNRYYPIVNNKQGFLYNAQNVGELEYFIRTIGSFVLLIRNNSYETNQKYDDNSTLKSKLDNIVSYYVNNNTSTLLTIRYSDYIKLSNKYQLTDESIYYKNLKNEDELKTTFVVYKNKQIETFLTYNETNKDKFATNDTIINLFKNNFIIDNTKAKIINSQINNSLTGFKEDTFVLNNLLGLKYDKPTNTVSELSDRRSFKEDNAVVLFADLSKDENVYYFNNILVPQYKSLTDIPLVFVDVSLAKYEFNSGYLTNNIDREKYNAFNSLYSDYYIQNTDFSLYCKKPNHRIDTSKDDEILTFTYKDSTDKIFDFISEKYSN